MTNVFNSLLLVIAGATHKELARQVKYLKVENQILRSRLSQRVTCTPKERHRLVKFAAKLGTAMRQLVTIVHPQTLLRWIREEKLAAAKHKSPIVRRGRRRTPEQVRRLILKLARENEWGYTRILGELRKLGIRSISRNTVKNILKAKGLDPGPQRGEGTWDEFLKQHAASLWQCDFFSRRILTLKGVREVYLLVFLHLETRRVVLSPATLHPDEAWVTAQAESFVQQARGDGLLIRYVQHDCDTKFPKSFDRALRRKQVKVIRTAFRSPNTNAFVERFVQSIQQECLDRFVIFGTDHCDHIAGEYLEYYHQERPHQSLGNDPLNTPKKRGRPPTKRGRIEDEIVPLEEIRCKERLGGLLKSYSRRAA